MNTSKKFFPWYKKQPLQLKKKTIFMHDNAPSHALVTHLKHYNNIWFKEARLMQWLACSSDLNPIKNFWSLL